MLTLYWGNTHHIVSPEGTSFTAHLRGMLVKKIDIPVYSIYEYEYIHGMNCEARGTGLYKAPQATVVTVVHSLYFIDHEF